MLCSHRRENVKSCEVKFVMKVLYRWMKKKRDTALSSSDKGLANVTIKAIPLDENKVENKKARKMSSIVKGRVAKPSFIEKNMIKTTSSSQMDIVKTKIWRKDNYKVQGERNKLLKRIW